MKCQNTKVKGNTFSSMKTQWVFNEDPLKTWVFNCNLGPRPKKTRKKPSTKGPTCLCFCKYFQNKQNKNSGDWVSATGGSRDEGRGFLWWATHRARSMVHPPGLGRRAGSPQRRGLFSPLSSGWQLLWLDGLDSRLRWWGVGQVSGWEPLPSSCRVVGDHGHPDHGHPNRSSENQAEIKCIVLQTTWDVTIPMSSFYNLHYHTTDDLLKAHQLTAQLVNQ